MKKRSTLAKTSPKGKRKRSTFDLFGVIHQIGSGLFKIFIFLTVITVVSFSFLFFYHYLLNSPYMKLEQVDMKGVDREMRDELMDMCGLDADQSLLSLSLYKLKTRMEEHPWIRSVKLERHFPHTLRVEVEREVPTALALTDRFYYVNRWGEIFKDVSESDDIDFPVITGLSENSSRVREELGRAVHVIGVLEPENDLWSLAELSEIHLKKDGGISIYFNHLKAEITFMWNEFTDKIEGLRKVTEHLNKSGKIHLVTHINLNYTDGAVVSFKNG